MPAVQVNRFEAKSADSPDETRTPPNQLVQVVNIGDHTLSRITMRPGWRWSENVKPIVGGDSCQASHLGYVVSGALKVQTADGEQHEVKAGEFYTIPPGHDAWNDGGEDFVGLEILSAAEYAKAP
jgi:mannose-6-phosphate isomerase-like protein (cupin superfamily)